MPLEKGQRVLPTITADAGSRPMTSKQARKMHQERSRGPKLTKEQRWSEERRLQAEIKRDIKRRDEEEKKAQERERNQLRGKQARDRAKLKEEAENAAKRKAGKPLKPPRPSQASILGFMRGNATAKKRAMVEEPDTRLSVIREESGSPASSAASSTKRRRVSDVNTTTTDCPGPEETLAEQAIRELDEAPPAEITNPEEETDDIPPLSLGDLALPGVPSGQATDSDQEDVQPEESTGPEEQTDIVPPLSPDNHAPPEVSSSQETDPHSPRSEQQQPEPKQGSHEHNLELEREQGYESRTASASPTPVSSPRPSYTARNMSLAISFSLDDFEDALASAAQLDEELQGPDNTPASDQAVEVTETIVSRPRDDAQDQTVKDTKTATSGVRDDAQDRERTVSKAEPDLMIFLPFLSTQDCSLSEADITEIETPRPSNPGPRNRTFNSATPIPRQSKSTMGPPRAPHQRPPTALRATSTQHRSPQFYRSPLAPIRNPAFRTFNADTNTPIKPAPAAKAPPTRPANLTDEDLSALQSEDWDDDLSLGKGPSPRPQRSSAAQPSQHHCHAVAGLSSSDIRTLASADWSDDL